MSVIEFNSTNGRNVIRTYTNPGEIVLDNCMGSGSTGVACIEANRKFIGMELDEKYFETAQKRLEKVEKELYSSR